MVWHDVVQRISYVGDAWSAFTDMFAPSGLLAVTSRIELTGHSALRSPQKNRHHMKRIMKKPIPPMGAHFRMSSSRLIFRAALRYLADSERNEVESEDIPDDQLTS